MGFCLLPFSVVLIFVFFFLRSRQAGIYTNIRRSFIFSLIANAVLIFGFNELASAFNILNSSAAIIFWLSEVVAVSGFLFYQNSISKISFSKLGTLRNAIKLSGFSKTNKIIVAAALVFYIIPLLFLSIYASQNNFDSHSYHLNRILIWIQNGNLDHFPTVHLQQTYLNVFAEYLALDTFLLAGSDQFTGIIQFGSFLGSLAGISLLAKRFGLKQNGQLLAAALQLTLPIGIFESTSTQVDYCACFFFVLFVYFGFELLQKPSNSTLFVFLLSLAFGGFSKYTIFIFGLPFAVYFGFRILLQYRIAYALKVLVLAVILLGAIFAPFFYRNYEIFGHVMRPLRGTAFASEELPVDKYGLKYTISGIVKNASLSLGLPDTRFNQFLENKIRDFHHLIGVDVDDLGLRLDAFTVKYSVHEDMIPNTLQLWMIVLCSILLFFIKGNTEFKWLWICAVLGFVLFCTLMKFQAWSTRTQMPFYTMGSLLIAYVFVQKLNWKIVWLAVPMMLISSVFVYGNPNKEIVSINFFTRKMLGHIPVAICETGGAQQELYEKTLGAYYVFPGENHCHPLRDWPGYAERRKVFSLLEKVGYYDEDKASNIFRIDRAHAYFLSHPDNFANFKPILDQVDWEHKNVGILFRQNGYYDYWAAISTKTAHPGKMQYIRYKKEFMTLPNAQKEFCYDYILSDLPAELAAFVPAANIDTIYTTRLFQLVKLKKPSCERNLY
ncbi:glycosyltransferase family 39 protein [Dyadobacter luticola]|uniref:Glycosyltransferase family 39 protein n=1 Tax=Dyadobacter luticola TaxID=1979387 RepID=A0A5R9KVW7_9BACT|nr:glycosyltransferase family 39 protein [Dyadobacter luticola]TLV00290.1 glycosyltransferase family 39 protein [Dyadobacter luticola]